MKNSKPKEVRLRGAPVSEGIAIGPPYFLSMQIGEIPEFPIKLCEVDTEINRYRKALFSSREDLTRLRGDLAQEGSDEAVTFIDTHIQMLDDPMITIQMEENIRQRLKNTESVFRSVIGDYEQRLTARNNSFFEQRLVDVRDVSNRILGHLCDQPFCYLSEVPTGSILFLREISPSHIALAHPEHIAAFVSETGGGNSHAALIARSKGIPYISDIAISSVMTTFSSIVIIDGAVGELILHPTEETLRSFQKRQEQLKKTAIRHAKSSNFAAETRDGFRVRLFANIGTPQELDVFPSSHDGVGLFRTEYLLFPESGFPTEEQQYRAYRELIEKCGNRCVVIRVFDVGGDKQPIPQMDKESNSAFDCRGIRFLLQHPALFSEQIRAIFKAAKGANVRILLPLISDVHELLAARKVIAKVGKKLGIKELPIGCMIEVPSAAMTCDALVRHADFLSIGTNDLMQYMLGIDRSNPAMNNLLYAAHPSMLRIIKMISTIGNAFSKPVTICGEIASNPLFIPLLLGLGLKEFSCAPRYLPSIKVTIRSWTVVETYQLAEKILQMEDPKDIVELLQRVKVA